MFPRNADINQNTVCNVTDLHTDLYQIHIYVTYMCNCFTTWSVSCL